MRSWAFWKGSVGGERVEYFETVRVRKDGQRLNVSISVSPIRDANGEIVGASIIARDVTGQRRAEDLLRQAQKMEAVGRLAGGVAHDFNNILGIVTACCELLRSRVADERRFAIHRQHSGGGQARRGLDAPTPRLQPPATERAAAPA